MALRVVSLHWGFSLGGVGKYASLIEGVSEYGDIAVHTICVLGPQRHVDRETLSELKNLQVFNRRGPLDLRWISEVGDSLKSIAPSLLLTHGFNGHFVAYMLNTVLRLKIPAIASYHGLYHATTPARRISGWIYNRFTEHYFRRRVVGVVAVAEFCAHYLLQKGIPEERITVVHNGIPDVKPEQGVRELLRQEWGVGEGERVIGVASRLDPVKGIKYLIDAFVAVKKQDPKVSLVVVGTGTSEDRLKEQVNEAGLGGDVRFLGFRSDISECLEAFDVFVLPSLAEYHSIGLLEAMRAGKIIVATDVGGNTESVRDRQEALIVPPADSQSLAEAISEVLSKSDLAKQLALAARQRFESTFRDDLTRKKTAEWLLLCAGS